MQVIKLKKINIEVLLKLVVLIGFTFFFSYILITDKIVLYINPRNIIYVKFAIVAMILLSLFLTRDIFKPQRRVKVSSYLIFIIPLIMASLFPPKSMDSSLISSMDVKFNQQTVNTSKNNTSTKANTNNNDENSNNQSTNNSSASNKEDFEIKISGDTIVMNDGNFLSYLTQIYDNMDKYKGKKIELTGFVFKNNDFSKNEFLCARLMMSCCTADLQPVGFLCHYNTEKDLKKDAWITVKGTLDITTYKEEKIPLLIVESIKNAEKPTKEYIYPY